jgi:hypothetical protein
LQLLQAPEPQQNPSTQWPLMHWAFNVQAVPFGDRFVHEPPRHMKPATQSRVVAQVVLQALAPQT